MGADGMSNYLWAVAIVIIHGLANWLETILP